MKSRLRKALDKGFKLNLITRPKGSEQTGKLSACTDIHITIEYMVQGALLSLINVMILEVGGLIRIFFKLVSK